MIQDNILSFNRLKYFKWAIALTILCIVLYAWDTPPIKPGGGTWLGYGLGTVGAILILWLLAFGIRKRAYNSKMGSVLGWLSAHVYLGIALAIVATLHTGFEFGWNVHTLAYTLTMLVIISGFWGVFLYYRQPVQMGNLLNGKTLQQHGQTLKDIDDQCRKIGEALPDNIKALLTASANSNIFASRWQRLTGVNPQCTTKYTLDHLEKYIKAENDPESEARHIAQEIYTLQFRRLQQLDLIRNFVHLRSWTEVWLLIHVPLAFGLFASLIAHVLSVFFYW